DCPNHVCSSICLDNSSKYALRLGTEFDSDDQAYAFYSKYAEIAGFCVRKDWFNRSQ
ncbi:hypothetical protein M569_14066, partial [Genlisea aurea]